MSAKIDGLEIPDKFIRHVLPFIGGVRIVGDVSGAKDCSLLKESLSSFKPGSAVSLDAVSTFGQKLDGKHTISEVKIEEKMTLLDRVELTFHIVLKQQ